MHIPVGKKQSSTHMHEADIWNTKALQSDAQKITYRRSYLGTFMKELCTWEQVREITEKMRMLRKETKNSLTITLNWKQAQKIVIYGGANLQHSHTLQASRSQVSRKSMSLTIEGKWRSPYQQLLCCPQLFHLTYRRELTLPPNSALQRQNSFYTCRRNLNFQDLCSDKNHISLINYLGILLKYTRKNPWN